MKTPSQYYSRTQRYAPATTSYDRPQRALRERQKMSGFDYFENVIGIKLSKSGKWRQALCPFHGEQNPSFSCNDDGAYRCFACGASGSSIMDFHKAHFKMDFKEALTDLVSAGVYDE
jgi:DNA primase